MNRIIIVLTLLGHPDFQALLQPTVLAAVAGDFVDDAVLLPVTSVHHVLLDAPPEEALWDRKTAAVRRRAGWSSGGGRDGCQTGGGGGGRGGYRGILAD